MSYNITITALGFGLIVIGIFAWLLHYPWLNIITVPTGVGAIFVAWYKPKTSKESYGHNNLQEVIDGVQDKDKVKC